MTGAPFRDAKTADARCCKGVAYKVLVSSFGSRRRCYWAVRDIIKQKRRQPFCVKQNGCRLSFYLPVFENIIHRQINGGFHTLADGIKYDFLQRALLGVFILLFLLFLTALGIIYSHFSLTSVVIFTSGISVLLR